jgi:hypothetical protein
MLSCIETTKAHTLVRYNLQQFSIVETTGIAIVRFIATPEAGVETHFSIAIGLSTGQTSIQQFTEYPFGFPP